MPKIELHLHLEGAIPYEALWELVKKYNGTNEVKSIEELKLKFQYTDFTHFIETWIWKNKFLCEYEDFTFIAGKVAEDLISQNIIYAEVFYSPPDFKYKNLDSKKITEAVAKGLKPYEDRVNLKLVADMVRDFGPENAKKTLLEINEVKDMGVIGIGIGGSEHAFPPEIFKDVYSKARELGFKTSAHAGEAAGAESVWGAVKELKVDRIGHCTRAIKDEKLVNYIIENKIPVELCPISNVRTGVVKSFKEHPVKQYYDRGMKVFLNTDDPKMFNNSLAEEYYLFVNTFGYGMDDVKVLLNNAVDSAWCSEEEKVSLYCELENYWKRKQL